MLTPKQSFEVTTKLNYYHNHYHSHYCCSWLRELIGRIDCYRIDPSSMQQVQQKPYVLISVSGQVCTQKNAEYI